MRLTLSFSPCPNDCFIFDAIVNHRIDLEGLQFSIQLADVETLNRAAFAGEADVTKLSFHAFAYCLAGYVLLDAGSALGRNCGPLLISKRTLAPDEVAAGKLSIAIPGKYTTANLLLDLAFPQSQNKTEIVFSEIEQALLKDKYDAGLIIHENRFTYEAKGLKKIIDLGEFWETETGAPLPLGGIVIKRSLADSLKHKVNRVLRRSVEYALAHRAASRDFVRANAQEMSEEVMNQHIDLYVNEYSIDLGNEGKRAVEMLFERCKATSVIPDSKETLFFGSARGKQHESPTGDTDPKCLGHSAELCLFEKLGWKKGWDWGTPPRFGGVYSGECKIFLCKDGQGGRGKSAHKMTFGPEANEAADKSVWMTIWVDDVDDVHRRCIEQGLEVTWPPTDMPWNVREMHVRHPDGHVFRVTEKLEDR